MRVGVINWFIIFYFHLKEFSAVQLWSDSDDRRLEVLLGTRERDTDTPDTVLSSSSPECVRSCSPWRFPALHVIKVSLFILYGNKFEKKTALESPIRVSYSNWGVFFYRKKVKKSFTADHRQQYHW